ncbi:MAG: tRNA uridine-5-carboxymethylaminomethyl(34) synthesis GTPase MnmE [Bacteroidales bacterium]|nr:tRNA uridine-5-carboxymethylaminomethyl(34) synthesis GTPase MnmE [Bacteroidales bacterium]
MNSSWTDTIIAPATIPGTGAISILRISGPDALRSVDGVISFKNGKCLDFKGYTSHYGIVRDESGHVLDEVVATVFRAPHSYTGEDSVEISCHASSYIVKTLIERFLSEGLRMAEPGEFTRRAFLNGKMDLSQAEAVADVISSTTSAAHRIAMNQLRGGFSRELSVLRSELLELSSLLELELDFSEEDVEFADRNKMLSLLDRTSSHIDALTRSFRDGNAIKRGVPVAIVGPANAGKSTLLNTLLKEDRAIVSEIAGTTRDTIEETLTLDGILFRFIDTAGLRDTGEEIEKIGIERSLKKITEADIVIYLVDPTSNSSLLEEGLSSFLDWIDFSIQKVIIAVNKTDLLGEKAPNKNVNAINSIVSRLDNEVVILNISAKTEEGVENLKKEIVSMKKDLLSGGDTTFVTNIRHFEALSRAASSLASVRTSLLSHTPTDLITVELHDCLSALSEITGEISTPDILNHIFEHHCIGK